MNEMNEARTIQLIESLTLFAEVTANTIVTMGQRINLLSERVTILNNRLEEAEHELETQKIVNKLLKPVEERDDTL